VSIYVEILIHGLIDDLWEKSQEPKLHHRWDLRFSEIDYLPRQPGEAQEFLYATRIGAGMRIVGVGESTGERDNRVGERTSALKSWSEDPKSLIEFGSGYWKYIPSSDGIRFITWYDYQTHRVWGPLFGYRGSFDVEWHSVRSGGIPNDLLPLRCERRE